MPTVTDTIAIAKVSQYLAANARANGGLFGAGIDRLLSRKLYCIRKNLEWLFGLDPTDSTLQGVADYLYALCAPYSGQAQVIINNGGSGTIINPNTGGAATLASISLEFELGVTGSPVVVNGVNVALPNNGDNSITLLLPNILSGSLLLTIGGVPQPTIPVTGSTYTTVSYSSTQATITLQPAGTVFQNGQTYLISGLQFVST